MRIKQLLSMTLALSLVFSCGDKSAIGEPELPKGDNPFFNEFKTPFNVPPFESIKNEHYLPAFEAGVKYQNEYIANILKQEASFATIEALENSSKVLSTVSTVFFPLTSAHTNDELEEINKEVSSLLTAHNDDIYMNAELFEKVKAVYDNKADYKLNGEQEKLLEKTYKSFVRSGINLDTEKQNALRELNKSISLLTVQFGQNVLSAVNNFELIIDNKSDLSGLPESLVNAAAEDAKAKGYEGKWRFTLQNPSAVPFLQYADNRDLRKKMYVAYTTKSEGGENNNAEIAKDIALLRVKRAQLLGYKNHSSYVLEEAMAKTPEKVNDLLMKLWEPAIAVAKDEREQMQELMSKSNKGQKLEAWDWEYYAEKVRQEKYKLDGEAVRPYLTLENVRTGIFTLCDKLYGLSFEQIKDIPVYQEDVTAFEVKDNGKHLGVLYMDFHPRESKKSGAWMTSYRKASIQNGKRIAPVITIVCNFSKPDGDTPALLTADEAETFFHEFGHALHGLLANTEYNSLSGTSVPRDFVELPSQVMENWVFEPELLAIFAKHYETGEVLPSDLVEKMDAASKFNQGFKTVEYLAASLLDMAFHTLESTEEFNTAEFEKQAMDKIGLIPEIAPRYRSTYFLHVFSGGYASSYYSYIWAEVLDSDAFAAFKESGDIFNKEIATSFRKNILEKGGTEDPMKMYNDFRGKEPDMKYLLAKRGLDKK